MSHLPYQPGPQARLPWLMKVLVATDQWVNALFGGDPDETISSRAARGRATHRWARWLCRVLDFFDPGHCDRSVGH